MLRFPPRRILAAVDATDVSARSWRAAREIAERFGASLEAVYCDVPMVAELAAYSELPAMDREFRRASLAAVRARLDKGARLHVSVGETASTLRRLARARGCDLLVIGTHRRRGLARLVFGSTAEAIVRDAGCPVLVVPGKMRRIRRILAPVHELDYARRGLLAGGYLARALKARLDVLTVVTDPIFGRNPEQLLRARIAELPAEVRRGVRAAGETRRGEPVKEILRACAGRDLLVLAAHRKSLLGDYVLGTTAERIIRYSPIPVLTIPSKP